MLWNLVKFLYPTQETVWD